MGESILDWMSDRIILSCFAIPVLLVVIPVVMFLCVQVSTGEKQYTGYIYAAEDGWAKTVGHLRFSENAGYDEQPSFCVDKKDGQQIKELAGSGKKVRVTIPSGFAIVVPWVCAIPASVEIMDVQTN